MTSILKPMLFIFLITISIVSCNNEELFVEPTADTPVETTTTPTDSTSTDTTTPPEDTTVDPVNTTTPCDFDLSTASSGDTIIINCMMDLGGQTVTLPSGVTIVYEGGDITNGTLNFSDNSVISGELLNSSVTLSGSTPQLKDPTFVFDPQRWGIVEGETTSDIALRNRDILEDMFVQAKAMGVTTFSIDRMDAYFEVGNIDNLDVFRSVDHAISIPSDFNLKMSNETYLRVFPNSSPNYALMAIFESKNITIDGGNLIGDRDRHDYSSGGSHEHGHCLQIRSGNGVTIKNASFSYGSGDGIDINSVGFSYDSDYNPSTNITITNNIFDSNRRDNISITDGRNIIVEYNELLNAGIDTEFSTGTNPKFGIDIEAVRHRNEFGVLVFDQIAEDIIIRNNTERGSVNGAFTVATGYNIIIENNFTESSISYSFGHDIKITGNELTYSATSSDYGISAGRTGGDETIYNNEISNNIVTGFPLGIIVYNRDTNIIENTFKEFKTGILVQKIKNIDISKNILTSSKLNSKGIFLSLTSLDNVNISDNTINVVSNPFIASNVNIEIDEENLKIKVLNNDFNSSTNSPILFSKSKGLDLINNKIKTGIQVFNSIGLSFSLNNIVTNNSNGIYLREINENITIANNNIHVVTGYECIKVQSTTISNEVLNTNNICD